MSQLKNTLLILLLSACGYNCFAQNDPKLTEVWDPEPALVTPGIGNGPPSDAIVLFDGKNLDQWTNQKGMPPGWVIKDGVLTVKPGSGSIITKRNFADCQLHVEWRSPAIVKGEGQERGNSGVLLQSRYELQILDSYKNRTYSNGQAGAIYKQHVPLVNASLKPGEWQKYDIFYTAPRFNLDSTIKTPAYITVVHNGILVQNHVEIKGTVAHVGQPKYQKHPFTQPLMLQEHEFPVSFRNIWIREINVQKLFNGKDKTGWYTYLDTLGKDNDIHNNFAVENGAVHVMGKYFGYMSTKKSYANYYLKVVFKWGTKQYAPRQTGKRDAGILYHFAETEKDTVWPKSIECQVQEEDCGDIWCVQHSNVDSPNKWETAWDQKHIFRTANFENPRGEWNTIEIICNGNQIEHYVNGHLVNWGKASLSEGKILLQSEGAEIFYKSVELIPL
ncbi:3-keto-disaccharide hydrolase [Mucilaginibacter pocheonensis]|uniref:3-keto-alpha-glucoside-1,2-lyase/3-keto-2-hydroxy-glucal hydratase domain-containing protein n=1 Tax=Mucilaginibacter pocheonensis TaxID=398050 RepID=A0ABU1TBD2_9SPHI|nr:DUF1080 domain-containing protein [Mucilaginibacter pocheonensis]MDR6942688.1 hypothetical protein [Mucilaginibacter pocheonensis]